MYDLIFSRGIVIALCYFAAANFISHVLKVGATRSTVFALVNIAAVWLMFFGTSRSGASAMLLYILIIALFWSLLYISTSKTGYLFLFSFMPPIALLVFAKTTGILFFVGMSYMMFRCAHVEWELKQRKIDMMTLPDFFAHCFFLPTLLIGPISPYSYFENSFNKKTNIPKKDIINCLLRMLKGALKIVVIAGIFLQLSPDGYLWDYRAHKFYEIVIAALGFYVYIYANFSGLNDISIGAAGLMGISVKENFNQPYLSQSITEMWTRWHITLSEWMRDIVFIPLAAFLMRRVPWLSRQQAVAVALMTVFLLIGWWHGNGVGWQYWMMGFLYGAAIVAEFYLGQWVRRRPDAQRLFPPPTVARIARTTYANLYFALVASLMSIDWQAHDVTFVDMLGKLTHVIEK